MKQLVINSGWRDFCGDEFYATFVLSEIVDLMAPGVQFQIKPSAEKMAVFKITDPFHLEQIAYRLLGVAADIKAEQKSKGNL